MASVQVEVNGRPYAVGCEDGQEAHVQALARAFDAQVRQVGRELGQLGELRLFLMAALVTADELADVHARLAQAQAELARHPAAGAGRAEPQADARLAQAAAEALDAAARRIDALADSLV
jgi:cell division protein ZapA